MQPRSNRKSDDTLWSGNLQLDWHATDDLLVYGGVNGGVKAGGFNAPATFGAGFPSKDIPYGPEVLLSYEAGFKGDALLGGTTRVIGSAFYYDAGHRLRNQPQRQVQRPGAGDGSTTVTRPGPEHQWLVSECAVVRYSAGAGSLPRLTAELRAPLPCAGAGPLPLPFGVGGGHTSAQVSGDYVSYIYDNIRNFDASKLPAYIVTDLRLAWESDDGRWQAALFANNVADRRYYTIGYDLSNATGSNSVVPGLPRWYGVNVRFNLH